MEVRVVREPAPPIKHVELVLSVDEAIQLQRTVTSSYHSVIKDRLFDLLTDLLRREAIPGGIYV